MDAAPRPALNARAYPCSRVNSSEQRRCSDGYASPDVDAASLEQPSAPWAQRFEPMSRTRTVRAVLSAATALFLAP